MASNNAPNVLRAICAALAFLAPLFALVLLVLAVSHPPGRAQTELRNRQRLRIKVLGAYLAIGSLAVLCILAGALGLSTALGPARETSLGIRGRAEVTVEALVFLELGVSVLYLTNESIANGLNAYWILVLVIELICATTISLIYPPILQGGVSPFIAPALCLLFISSTLPVLLFALHAHTSKQKPSIEQTFSPMTEIRTPSFSGTRLSVQSSALPVSSHPYSSDPPTSSHHQEEVLTPKSSISDLTAVNHSQAACLGRNSGNANPNTLESGTPGDDALGHRIVSSRSQSLLIFLIASQLAAFLAFLLEIAAVKVGLSPSLGSDASASNYAIIHILRTAFMVLCITGIMTAFLLHAYNSYLGASRSFTDTTILPPAVDLSRMNAITVSLSTPPTTSLSLCPTGKRSTARSLAPPALEKVSKKLSFKGRFTDVATDAGNTQIVPSGMAAVDSGAYASKDGCDYGRKGFPKDPLSHHRSSASYSSSFACPLARKVPFDSTLMAPEATQDAPEPRWKADDSKFDEDDDSGEPGYAYIYADGSTSTSELDSKSQMDPLDVGRPFPFPSRQHRTLQYAQSDANRTHRADENSASSIPPAPLGPLSSAPIDIPPSKNSNPYPTPRSTPTATTLTEGSSSPDVPTSPTPSPQSSRSFHLTANTRMTQYTTISCYDNHSPSLGGMGRDPDQRSYCSSSTHMAPRSASPTPTPTRAPTPGLGFTPFLGPYVRKRSSTSTKSRPRPPSPSLLANIKDKAKIKHESISESLAQSFEGICNGLGGSNGKTKYPLRSSTSQTSLGLGLGIIKFPTISRRPSETGKGSRNCSTSSLAETAEDADEGDFMDLRDPFACPNFMHDGKLRIVSQIKGGRESRTGYREDDLFDPEGDLGSLPGSCGRTRGARMSAWGKLPSPASASSSASNTPFSTRYYQYPPSPAPTPTRTPVKSKRRGDKKGKSRSKSSKAESSWSGGSLGCDSACGELPGKGCFEDIDFLREEALIAQQLLMKLDEKSALTERSSQR